MKRQGTLARRNRERQQREEVLIDAAEQVFARKGFGAATMDDVASEAAYSKGLLYKHFQSKDDLFQAVCLRGFNLMLRLFRKAASEHAKGIERLVAVGQAYVGFAQRHPLYFEANVFHSTQEPNTDPASFAARAERVGDEILQLVIDILVDGIRDGSIKDDVDPKQTAFMLWGAMYGLVVTATFRKSLARFGQDPPGFLLSSLGFLSDAIGSDDRSHPSL